MAWNLYDYPSSLKGFMLQSNSPEFHLGLISVSGQAKIGLNAFKQGVFIIDKNTQGPVTPLSRDLRLIFKVSRQEQLKLELKRDDKVLKHWPIQTQAGINIFDFRLSEKDIQTVLTLKQRLFLKSRALLDFKGASIPSSEAPLSLRFG